MKDKIATVTFTSSKVTPVQVDFPKSIGHYKTLEDAMTDIKLFGCKAIIHASPEVSKN